MPHKQVKIIVVALPLLMAASCKNEQASIQAPPAIAVTVQQVATSDAVYYEEYPALVKAS